MAQFSINTQRVRSLTGDEAAMARKLSGFADEIRQIAGGLGMSSRTASSIQSSLRSAAGKTDRHSGSMSGMNSALSSIADKYDSAERAICNSSRFKAIASGGAADALKAPSAADLQNWLVRMSGAVAKTVGGIFSPVVTILQEQIGNITEVIRSAGKTDTTDRRPTAGWAAGVMTNITAGVTAAAAEMLFIADLESKVGTRLTDLDGEKKENVNYFSSRNISFQGGYVGQCTWYAYGRFMEVTGIALNSARNANTWLYNNADDIRVQVIRGAENIRYPAIAVSETGEYGHVMFVEGVEYNADGTPATVYFTESNANGDHKLDATDGILKKLSYQEFCNEKKVAGYITPAK